MLKKFFRTVLVSVVSTASFTFAAEPVDPCEKPASLETTEVEGKTFYKIGTCGDLYKFADMVAGGETAINGMLTTNITVNTDVLKDGGLNTSKSGSFKSWTPIGTSEKPYNGVFQGYNFSVSGLFFDDNDADNVGFFGVIGQNASVCCMEILDSYFNGFSNVGGIVGTNNGSIADFINQGSVNGRSYVGGLVGGNGVGGNVAKGGNFGPVDGYEVVGGLVGVNSGKIVYSFNVGSVSGSDVVGGLIGYNEGDEVSSVYNAGSVGGMMSGAIVGLNEGTITNSYYNVDFPCEKCSVIEGVGLTTAQLASAPLPEGFDEDYWNLDKTVKKNDGTVRFFFPSSVNSDVSINGSLIAESADSGKVLLENGITVYAPAVLFPENNDQSATVFGYSKGPAATENLKNATVEYKRTFAAVGENLYSTVMFPFSADVPEGIKASFHQFAGMEYKDEKWQVVVNETKETSLTANTPYLVQVEEGETVNSITFTGATFEEVGGGTKSVLMSEGSPWKLVGTYEYKDWKRGDKDLGNVYGFAGTAGNASETVGKFGKVGAGAYIYPMRVYLEYSDSFAGRPAANGSKPAVTANTVADNANTVAALPEEIEVVMVKKDEKTGEETTKVIGSLNSRTGEIKFANDRWFDLNGRYLGNKKPTQKGAYYNNGKKVFVK
ncbi:hypothetical protein [Fibrobacter sp.]|uniref:hypothetical protein n=1 Tax=Fibrobacter sp. TaxID=35828 RepID=UPI00388FD16B